jgi:iron complex transport system substrate-binding protein
MDINLISGAVVGAAIRLHQRLGPGLLESVYEDLLTLSLRRSGFEVEQQKLITFTFEGITFDRGLRLDMLVNERLIVELKSVEKCPPVYSKQVLTYLRLTNLEVGLLLNFGAETMHQGITRIVNNHKPSAPLR